MDIVIVGAGIMGLTLAYRIKQALPDLKIAILDKEAALGKHASGRNSGVIHSGIYYPEGSLKAKLCADGGAQLKEFCNENQLPLKMVGKVILPTCEADDAQLDMLLHRARANGAEIELIDNQVLRQLEPDAYSITGRALYSPGTASVEPKPILTCLAEHLKEKGVEIWLNQQVHNVDPVKQRLQTQDQTISWKYLINTAGVHADTIAKSFGLGQQYTILPFKGLYYNLSPSSGLQIKHHIYPVPDLRVPFLGVHFTQSVSGQVYLGPTAIPAFGREHYDLVKGLSLKETPGICANLMKLYQQNQQGFRTLVHQEATRFWKPQFVKACQSLIPKISSKDLVSSPKVGIRAQLLDLKTGKLVMDFLIEEKENSLHILNAVSPAFTSAFSFAQLITEKCIKHN